MNGQRPAPGPDEPPVDGVPADGTPTPEDGPVADAGRPAADTSAEPAA